LLVKGYAGTGKTTCVSAMVRTLKSIGINSTLLAPTGRAAKVLGNYSGEPAWTMHREIYRRKADRSGNFYFELRDNQHSDTLFFVDEASMIGTEKTGMNPGVIASGDLLEDLITYVFAGENCRVVFIGDTAQLPPVGSDQSPALQLGYLRSTFNLNIAEMMLTEVIRQQKGSGILENATATRQLIAQRKLELPKLKIGEFADVNLVQSDVQPIVESALIQHGKDNTIIITRSNKRANLFNQQVRLNILGHEEEINATDRMMVLKNNYFWLDEKGVERAGFIANGDVIEVKRIRKFEDRGTYRFCRATISLIDYPDLEEMEVLLLCNSIWEEAPSLSFEKMRGLYDMVAEDYAHLESRPKIRKAIQEDPYYNALQVKFAYAVTCHKAQGGQWSCVFVDQGYITDEMVGVELNRWLYTAFTRAQKELWLVGFDERFF